MVTGRALAWLPIVSALGCSWAPLEPPSSDRACVSYDDSSAGTATISMRFDAVEDEDAFFAAPFPAFGRKGDASGAGSDGSRFPVTTPLGDRLRALLPTDGYALSAGIFFELSVAVDPAKLPAFTAPTVATDGGTQPAVLVFPLDAPASPAAIRVEQARSPYGSVLLNVLPVQGLPLHENTDYVVIVTTDVGASAGDTMTALCAAAEGGAGGQALPQVGLDDPADVGRYVQAIGVAGGLGLRCDQIAAMSVFHTTDPTADMRAARDLARSDYAQGQGACQVQMQRDPPASDVHRCDKAPFCVYAGYVYLPQYQRGAPPYLPYLQWGGGWPSPPVASPTPGPAGCDLSVVNVPEPTDPASWTPTWRSARVVVTIPRAPPPAAGYPTVVYVRAGAGTNTDPLVDRGPQLAPNCGNTTDCRGPAEVFQNVGFAGITIDGPLVGESRLEPGFGGNEDFNIYNFLNPIAQRDNLRQSAVELTLVPDILGQLQVDLSQCEMGEPGQASVSGTGFATFDVEHLAMFSHSMGSSIAPLALATDPRYRVAILSGSGGSNIENVAYKAAPVPIYVAGSLLDLSTDCRVDEFPLGLSLLQWATESSDSAVYARRMVLDAAPAHATWWSPVARSVLMIQGLVDHDILPPIADVMTLGEGLDLGLGPSSCYASATCDRMPVYGEVASLSYPSIAELLPLSGHHALDLSLVTGNVPWPARVPRPPNATGDLTAVLVQHRIDQNREPAGQECIGINGHEVIYESTLARHQYGCFLDDFAHDRPPQVRADGPELGSCEP
jgi:hypothetical protein